MAQLHQSRLGLVSQAFMLIITVCFLLSEILGEFWKKKWAEFLTQPADSFHQWFIELFVWFQGRFGESEHIWRSFSCGRTRSCFVVPLCLMELYQVTFFFLFQVLFIHINWRVNWRVNVQKCTRCDVCVGLHYKIVTADLIFCRLDQSNCGFWTRRKFWNDLTLPRRWKRMKRVCELMRPPQLKLLVIIHFLERNTEWHEC